MGCGNRECRRGKKKEMGGKQKRKKEGRRRRRRRMTKKRRKAQRKQREPERRVSGNAEERRRGPRTAGSQMHSSIGRGRGQDKGQRRRWRGRWGERGRRRMNNPRKSTLMRPLLYRAPSPSPPPNSQAQYHVDCYHKRNRSWVLIWEPHSNKRAWRRAEIAAPENGRDSSWQRFLGVG